MNSFIHDDFLLQNEAAKELYHNYSKKQPIIDYHCHLIPEYIANDHQFDNLGQIWLEGDHYKWRAMRTNGIEENIVRGKTLPIGKNMKSGWKQYPTPCEIPCITGHTWN